ncbi:hypothetical protein DRA43_02995 [Micromonospora provocatoris]|nr:hypothetical protein [Micromonospora provocatoris]RBJ10093.1 hypothetical protein DRA43_02995 [Micromonospora provocatoris]
MKRALSMLTVLVTIGAGLTAGAPAAQAAGSCSGTITYSQVQSSGLGELVIYYNSSNGGTNSACFYHRGPAYGKSAPTFVQIYRCAERSGEGAHCTRSGGADTNSGDFSYYAGPVAVTGTANYCVEAVGYIGWAGQRHQIYSRRQGC